MSSESFLNRISLTSDDLESSKDATSAYLSEKSSAEVAVENIANDQTLDEATKIDLIADERGWFRGEDMSIIDDFLAGKATAAETASKLADPIDEAYSTADHGRQYYQAEETAKHQRAFYTPEEALKRWGAPQEFPKPSEELQNLPSTEGQLWDLWYTILHAAKRIPWTDHKEQEKLLSVVQLLGSRPDPPQPSPMTIPLKADWIWSTGTLWSDLLMLGPSAREMWNDCCGCGAGWTLPEQHAWTNINAFVARLTNTGTKDFQLYAIWALRDALEDEFHPQGMHQKTDCLTDLSLHLTVAYVWLEIAGKMLYKQRTIDERACDVDINLRERKLPWYTEQDVSTARWEFWRKRFEQEAENGELSAEVRGQALKAALLISSFQKDI